ncbi:MAG: hypothetical protein ACLQIB_16805 [Isosphaeraceae bacterium]
MSEREFLQVDPGTLHLPGGRRDGADPVNTGTIPVAVGGLPTVRERL